MLVTNKAKKTTATVRSSISTGTQDNGAGKAGSRIDMRIINVLAILGLFVVIPLCCIYEILENSVTILVIPVLLTTFLLFDFIDFNRFGESILCPKD